MKLVWLSFAFAGCLQAARSAEKISFNSQIQPILSENCYPCHGPDSSARKPKKHPLRLDREQLAFQPRDNGKPVILRDDPQASEMLRRLKATDDDVMPPASEHKKVKPEQIALIEKWIVQGAKYEKHWALIPPSRPKVPEDGRAWAKTPIDRFVARKLAENGLKPNPEEQRARLFRRLSFDLTGLPPSPKEVEEFLRDKSSAAYEKAVERMLGSYASAEQFTRLWLDAVRYADTQGIHHDHSRSIWPYRDWVIGAYKANLPFTEFTLEQIAGDLLPGATLEQKIASGYNRLLPTSGEGGAIAEEYAAIYAKDRVDTTAAVWLGLTTGCATCHDHKFDPISTKEFYSMTAFFRNHTMPSLDSSVSGDTAPLLFVPAKADRARWPELEQAISTNDQAIEARKRVARPEFESWLAAAKAGPLESLPEVMPVLHLPLTETNGPCRGTFQGSGVEWPGSTESRPGPFGAAPLVNGGTALAESGPSTARDATEPPAGKGTPVEMNPLAFTRTGQASYGALVYLEGKPNGAVFSRMNKAEAYRGWDLFLSEGRPTVHIIDQWPDAALKVTAKEALEPGRWRHLLVVFDGTRDGAEALSLYVDGRKVEVQVNNNSLGTNIVAQAPFRLGGRSDSTGTSDTLKNGKVFVQDVRFYNQALTSIEAARLAAAGLVREHSTNPSDQSSNALYELYLTGFDPPSLQLQTQLAKLKTEEGQVRKRGATTLVMEEKQDSEPTAWVLTRGNYANKGAQVSAAIPEALPPMKPEMPRNRLGLAQWILSPENPLTARVTVNRLWSQIFGLGIVETTEDFGVMGARPGNQPLLDWLAVEFVDSGWDFRHLIKEMVLSSTYRQSEAVSPEKLERDPLNRLCSRGPHVRLDAEEIRDQALAAAGLLVRKVGGPPVKPYQPEGLWEAVAMKDSNTRVYKPDAGEGLYRRSVYTFWKRVAPPASLEILNAPSREVFCARRERTDTPLQAFVTMNDPQFVEAARQLAAQSLKSAKGFDERLDQVTEPLLARRLTKSERAIVERMEQRALNNYEKDPAAAHSLLTVGESKADPALAPAELAAWTLVASQIINLDEALTK